MKSGIYRIRNIINNKCYIGSAINTNKRWNVHKHLLRKGKHFNDYLQNAWNKHSEQNFLFEIVESIKNKNILVQREQYYLDILCPEYNICKRAESTYGASFYKSEEFKSKISVTCRDGRRKGENNPMYGKHCSKETKEKIRNSLIGRKHTEETKNKMSLAQKGKHNKLTNNQMIEIKNLYNNGVKVFEISKLYNIAKTSVYNIIRR